MTAGATPTAPMCRSASMAAMTHSRFLPQLGPASVRMLRAAGIDTPAQLQALGSVQAYVRVLQAHAHAQHGTAPRPSLNLLWALEAALTGQDWRTVAREERTRLLMALEQARGQPNP